MNDDEELKEGLKKSMSEPAKKKKQSLQSRHEEGVSPLEDQEMHEWNKKFDRNRG